MNGKNPATLFISMAGYGIKSLRYSKYQFLRQRTA